MSHPDNSWRVGAIYRCCYRYGMTQEVATTHMNKMFKPYGDGKNACVELWFRPEWGGQSHIAHRRAEWLEQQKEPTA